LADYQFLRPQKIDLLIGASLFFDLLCVGQIKLPDALPILLKNRFGWIVTGGGSKPNKASSLTGKSNASGGTGGQILVDRNHC